MSKFRSAHDNRYARIVKKASVSIFVVSSFLAYTLQQHFATSQSVAPSNLPDQQNVVQMVGLTTRRAYRDGTYTGNTVRAGYGRVQIQVVVQNGKVLHIQFLDYPHDLQTSQKINTRAMPLLQQEAIQGQTAQVDAVSGATITSQAFNASLQSALDLARN